MAMETTRPGRTFRPAGRLTNSTVASAPGLHRTLTCKRPSGLIPIQWHAAPLQPTARRPRDRHLWMDRIDAEARHVSEQRWRWSQVHEAISDGASTLGRLDHGSNAVMVGAALPAEVMLHCNRAEGVDGGPPS